MRDKGVNKVKEDEKEEMDESILLRQIEAVRQTMNRLGKVKSLTDPEMIELSEELDSLLNKYHELTQERDESKSS